MAVMWAANSVDMMVLMSVVWLALMQAASWVEMKVAWKDDCWAGPKARWRVALTVDDLVALTVVLWVLWMADL